MAAQKFDHNEKYLQPGMQRYYAPSISASRKKENEARHRLENLREELELKREQDGYV